MRFIIILIIWIMTAGHVAGQSCTIRFAGQVLDKATREPLEYSSIAIQEANLYTLADSDGHFIIEGLCPGAYHIQVYHLGCPPGKYFFSIVKDTSIIVYLDHHGELLREVLVEGNSNSFQQAGTQQSISAAVIRDLAGQSLADITEQIAGVRTLRNGSGITKPIIHGLYGNRVAIVNNGLIQAGQQWGTDHAPEVDPNAINLITVVKGADAIAYGSQALGGALLVEAGPINIDPHLHGRIGYALETNGRGHTLTAAATKSIQKFDWRMTGTLKKFGDHHTPDYFLTNTGTTELNGSLQMVYRASPKWQHQIYYSLFTSSLGILAGSHISNLTDLEEAITSEVPFNTQDNFSYALQPPRQEIRHQLLKYTGKKFVDEKIFIEWVYGVQYDHRKEFDIRRSDRSEKPALDLKMWANTFQFKYINDHARLRYKLGIQATYTDNENNYETGILPLIPDYREGVLGLYSLFQYPTGKFILEGGARYDLQVLQAWPITLTVPREIIPMDHLFHDYAISVGGVFQPDHDLETRLQLAATQRSPDPNELYSNGLHQGVAGIEEGNWDLQSELSFKSILTQTLSLDHILRFEVSAYSHLIYRYIYLKPEDEFRLTIRGAFPVYTYTQDDAWIRGVDLVMISDFSHHLEWNAKLSLVRGTTIGEDRALPFIPPAYLSSSIAWAFHDSPVFKGTKLSVEGEYTARQNNWDPESDFLPPPDDYFLLALRCNTGFSMGSNMIYAGISIENLLNISYRDYLNRLRYYADEQGLNVRVNLRYEF